MALARSRQRRWPRSDFVREEQIEHDVSPGIRRCWMAFRQYLKNGKTRRDLLRRLTWEGIGDERFPYTLNHHRHVLLFLLVDVVVDLGTRTVLAVDGRNWRLVVHVGASMIDWPSPGLPVTLDVFEAFL